MTLRLTNDGVDNIPRRARMSRVIETWRVIQVLIKTSYADVDPWEPKAGGGRLERLENSSDRISHSRH